MKPKIRLDPTLARLAGLLLMLVLGAAGLRPAAAAAADAKPVKAFAYVGPNYVITAEVGGPHSFVVNFINLSDFVIVVQASDFIYKGASGRFYIGQVYEAEHKDTRGASWKYSASVLLKGHTFTGLTLAGAFRELDAIEELSLRIGAKRFYLQPMEQVYFEQLAAKIGELDVKAANPKAALETANIAELGSVKSTDGSAEWDRDWQGLIDTNGVNNPKIVEKPEVVPTDEARKKNVHGAVRIGATLTKNGALQDLKVLKGLGAGLDERALEAVQNSWVLLPATKNGEVVETTLTLVVDFPPPGTKRP
jgi:TonB family protein